MDVKKFALACNVMGAVVSLTAAWYWLQSSKTKLPAIDPTTRKPVGPVSMLELNATVVESARTNKIAAILTGLSTILLGVGGFLGS
jgi:hypothetical protein